MQQHTQTKKDVLFLSSVCNNVKSFKEKKSELWMQRFNNFISLSNAPVSGSAVSVGSQNYKDQHAQSSTWKNVVYNILVLRFLRGGPARGRKKNSACLDMFTWTQKVKHRDNKIRPHTFISEEISACKVWELFEDALIRLCGAPHKQTGGLLSPYFSQQSSFLQRKSLDMYDADVSVSWGCVKGWVCSLSGLHLSSTSKTPSDHHPKADKPSVDFIVNHFDFCIFESSLYENVERLSFALTC